MAAAAPGLLPQGQEVRTLGLVLGGLHPLLSYPLRGSLPLREQEGPVCLLQAAAVCLGESQFELPHPRPSPWK